MKKKTRYSCVIETRENTRKSAVIPSKLAIREEIASKLAKKSWKNCRNSSFNK